MVQFYPWFEFYFPLFLVTDMHDNEFETKENKIKTKKKKIEPQDIHVSKSFCLKNLKFLTQILFATIGRSAYNNFIWTQMGKNRKTSHQVSQN